MDDMWGVIATERGALADDLAALDDAAWATPSLCTDWTVRDTVAPPRWTPWSPSPTSTGAPTP